MVPTTIGHNFGFGATIYKSAGTTNTSYDIDYMDVVGRLGSRR